MRISTLFLVWMVIVTDVALADAPTAVYLFPAGGQRGTDVQFRLGGYDLHDG